MFFFCKVVANNEICSSAENSRRKTRDHLSVMISKRKKNIFIYIFCRLIFFFGVICKVCLDIEAMDLSDVISFVF